MVLNLKMFLLEYKYYIHSPIPTLLRYANGGNFNIGRRETVCQKNFIKSSGGGKFNIEREQQRGKSYGQQLTKLLEAFIRLSETCC